MGPRRWIYPTAGAKLEMKELDLKELFESDKKSPYL